MSDARQKILEALAESAKALRPVDVAERADIGHGTARNLMPKMAKDGEILQLRGGYYEPVSDTSHEADGTSERVTANRVSEARNEYPGVRKDVRKGGGASGRSTTDTEPSSQPNENERPSPESLVQIPYVVDVEAAAHGVDSGGFLVDTDAVEIEPSGVHLPAWYIRSEYGVSPERLLFIRASGDSMSPTIRPGQRVLVALLVEGTQIRDGLIYILEGPGGVLVKRLYLTPDHVTIHSDNPDAPTYNVGLETFERDYILRAAVLETPQRH